MLLIDVHSNAICNAEFRLAENFASNSCSFQCNLQCRIQTGREFFWVTQHLQKQICSTLLCTIYCLNYFAKMLSRPQSYMESNCASNWYSFQCNVCNLQCRIQTGREFCWVTRHLQKQICSTLLCTIYYLNYFSKMLSGPQSYMESNSASNWYSYQCNLQCRIQLQTGVEFCWVTQHLRKQILLCTIYCLNYFAKMLSGPQSYIKSNSASNRYSFQCNLQCRIQTGVEFCWVTQHLQK